MAYSQKNTVLGNCSNCTHNCARGCQKGKHYKVDKDYRIRTPPSTPYAPTPYTNYLIYGRAGDMKRPRVNATMQDEPAYSHPYSTHTQDYLQAQTAERFLAGSTPHFHERSKGGLTRPFFR